MDDRGTSPSIVKEAAATPVAVASATTPPPASAKLKILSRNANATVVMTSSPSNEAELQLYRVMQRASLLAYYDTLLEMGGDDVQQLCDAGEEEFLEIMALVGMASKPLHVRRLQKALQEWVTNPGLFQSPLLPSTLNSPVPSCCSVANPAGPAIPALPSSVPTSPVLPSTPLLTSFAPVVNTTSNIVKEVPRPRSSPQQVGGETSQISIIGPSTSPGPSPGSPLQLTPVLMESQINRLAESARALVKNLPQFEPKPHNTKKKICRDLENVMTMPEDDPRRMEEIRKYAAIYGRFDCKRKPEKPLTLHEVSVNEAAAQICRFAPALLTRRDELFPLARQVVRDSGYHYSKTHSSLTPMFRTHSSAKSLRNGEESHLLKRPRLDAQSPPSNELTDSERLRRQERLEAIADELRCLGERTEELVSAAQQVRENNDLSSIHSLQHQMELVQNKQTQLLVEQSELLKQPLPMRIYRRNSMNRSMPYNETDKPDTDDTDSQLSFSNASSPSQEVGDSRDSLGDGTSNNNVNINGKCGRKDGKQSQVSECLSDDGMSFSKNSEDNYDPFYHDTKVISASGGNIIAVANPALSMSPLLPSADSLPKHSSQSHSTSPLSLKMERQSPRLVDPD